MRTSIQPGQIWLDTDGNRIHAHGGSLLEVDETFDFDDRRLTGSFDVVGEPRVPASAERSLSQAVVEHA